MPSYYNKLRGKKLNEFIVNFHLFNFFITRLYVDGYGICSFVVSEVCKYLNIRTIVERKANYIVKGFYYIPVKRFTKHCRHHCNYTYHHQRVTWISLQYG